MAVIKGTQLMEIMRNTLNKIDSRLIDHGDRVAYMVWKTICFDGTLSPIEVRDITITSFLHDIGAYKTDEIDKMIEFETKNVLNHSIYGYLFLNYLAPLKDYSRMVLCHHLPYIDIQQYNFPEWKWTQILSIADRFDVAMSIEHSTALAKEKLYSHADILFSKKLLDFFFSADDNLHFIDDIYTEKKNLIFDILTDTDHSEEELRSYLDMISYSIDFRSQFMITHTMTTNRISLKIADILKLSFQDKEKIDLGSILHDLGKVAIPVDILDFPGKLDTVQMNIMKKHVTYTAEILNHLLDDDIIQIAIRHHEKLNGKGYPKGLSAKDLNTNERIVAIADIMSALYEQRSYKGALDKPNIVKILNKNAESGYIDSNIVSIAIEHFDEIIAHVHAECDTMIKTYKLMSKKYIYINHHYQEFLSELSANES